MTVTTINLPRPHSKGQYDLLDRRYTDVAFCGRRWGKTQVGVYRILQGVTDENAIGLYWWVGLSWRSASMKRAWRLLKYYARKIWRALGRQDSDFIKEVAKEIEFPNGSQVWLRSAENPDSLAGEAVRGVVVDEFSLMAEVIWTEFLEATLLDYEGWALFIGVPKGNNWAAKLWRQALTREGWRQHRYKTSDNPKMSTERLDNIKQSTPETIYLQEYEAEILEGEGTVFRRVGACASAIPREPYEGDFVGGLDFGQQNDFTVISVFDAKTKTEVDRDRFNQIGWGIQRGRIKAMCEKWNLRLLVCELNSIGSPNFEELEKEDLPVIGFMTTAQSKPPLIESLVLAFEQDEIRILNDPIGINEFEVYERQVNRVTHRSQYSAPVGLHDDVVMAVGLAWHGVQTPDWIFYDGEFH